MTKSTIVNPHTVTILLVEDSESDIRLIKEFLKEIDMDNNLYIVKDGIEAIEFLHMHYKPSNSRYPDIVILDLNLPRMSGHEVLKEMKKDNDLKKIPVIILTTSTAEEDVTKCYNHYANCYIAKPADFDEFIKVMESIKDFWLEIAKLPIE